MTSWCDTCHDVPCTIMTCHVIILGGDYRWCGNLLVWYMSLCSMYYYDVSCHDFMWWPEMMWQPHGVIHVMVFHVVLWHVMSWFQVVTTDDVSTSWCDTCHYVPYTIMTCQVVTTDDVVTSWCGGKQNRFQLQDSSGVPRYLLSYCVFFISYHIISYHIK